jgi:hypothetical protein
MSISSLPPHRRRDQPGATGPPRGTMQELHWTPWKHRRAGRFAGRRRRCELCRPQAPLRAPPTAGAPPHASFTDRRTAAGAACGSAVQLRWPASSTGHRSWAPLASPRRGDKLRQPRPVPFACHLARLSSGLRPSFRVGPRRCKRADRRGIFASRFRWNPKCVNGLHSPLEGVLIGKSTVHNPFLGLGPRVGRGLRLESLDFPGGGGGTWLGISTSWVSSRRRPLKLLHFLQKGPVKICVREQNRRKAPTR